MGLNPNKISFQRGRLYLPATRFDQLIKAPTITIVGGDASIVEIGLADDANGSALAKVAATTRTGIAGVQAPSILSAADSSVVIGPVAGASGLIGAAFAAVNDALRLTMAIPVDWDRRRAIRVRHFWSSTSTTTSEVGQLGFSIILMGDHQLLVQPSAFTNVNDSPSSTANQLLITPWSVDIGTPWDADMTDTDEFMTVQTSRGASDTLTGTLHFFGTQIEYYRDFGKNSGRGGESRPVTVAG